MKKGTIVGMCAIMVGCIIGTVGVTADRTVPAIQATSSIMESLHPDDITTSEVSNVQPSESVSVSETTAVQEAGSTSSVETESSTGGDSSTIETSTNITQDETGVNVDITVEIIEPTTEEPTTVPPILAKITEIYSVNNKLNDCYYKPLFSDIPNLEMKISKDYGFVTAYSGYFDLDRTVESRGNENNQRALEVLGNDFLLSDEEYSFNTNVYTATECTQNSVDVLTAVMNIYKAIGQVEYDITSKTFSVPLADMKNSPAILNLPGYIDNIDTSMGHTMVFISRTNRDLYLQRALKDLFLSVEDYSNAITVSDFLIYTAYLMDLYGEPVIGEQELYQLLQVFGGDMPEYLNTKEQEAYIYLFARGCLNETLDFSSLITRDQMLNILMCVADEGSRTNLKEIQLTADLDSELVQKGCFRKVITITNDVNAPSIEVEIDHSTVNRFDYYVLVDEHTRFHSEGGSNSISSGIYINGGNGTRAIGTSYLGIEVVNGKQYYHFTCNALSAEAVPQGVDGSGNYPGYFQINTKKDSDLPWRLWMPWGGGVYQFARIGEGEEVVLSRTSFDMANQQATVKEESYPWSSKLSDNDRRLASAGSKPRQTSILESMFKWIIPTRVEAARTSNAFTGGVNNNSGNTSTVKITIKNADHITNLSSFNQYKIADYSTEDEVIWSVLACNVDKILAGIKIDGNVETTTFTQGVSSVTTDGIWLSYKELESAGLVISNRTSGDGNTVPQPDNDGNIEFWSTAGLVRLNNETKEIIVGNVIYKVNSHVELYYQPAKSDDLYIDFRVIYGWSNAQHAIDYGTGDNYTIAVKSNAVDGVSIIDINGSNANQYTGVIDTTKTIKFTQEYTDNTHTWMGCQLVKDGVFPNNRGIKYVANYGYALSNWIVYYGLDRDYLFVFYRKDAFESWGLNPTEVGLSTFDDLQRITGYSLPVKDDQLVVRIVDLTVAYGNSTLPQRSDGNSIKGQFMYDKDFGYLYNLPEWSTYSTPEAYLKGEVLLPLYINSNISSDVYNINVNSFRVEDIPQKFGYVPSVYTRAGVNGTSYNVLVDLKGKATEIEYESTAKLKMDPAPAGVISWFGGISNEAGLISSTNVGELLKVGFSNKSNVRAFYGTMAGQFWDNTDTFHITLRGGDICTVKMTAAGRETRVYAIGSKKASETEDTVVFYYGIFGDMFESKVEVTEEETETQTEKEEIIVEYVGSDETEDEWEIDEKHGLDKLIAILDKGSSLIITIVFFIIPIIGITALTILVGFSMLSDNKIVLWFCDHIIDPVYIITLGHKRCGELNLHSSFFGLILGYIAFILMFNGILLRIISAVMNGFHFILSYWRF